MPLFEYVCERGHRDERYLPRAEQAPAQMPCRLCGADGRRVPSLFRALNYFSECNGRVIENLAPGVPIHSHAQHQRLMKAAGLTPATDWHTSKRPSRV